MHHIPEETLLEVGTSAARAAGKILQDWSSRFSVTEKSCSADVVTEADVESQHAIQEFIDRSFPTHGILGEEGLNRPAADSHYRWIVDPLDGTSNYVHGFPYYAVSIGVELAGELIVGIVFDPTRQEMYTAIKGGGAWCNGRRLQVSGISSLKDSLLVASFPPGAKRDSRPIQQFLEILPQAQTVQRTGSAAMNLANVAAGRIDGFWSFSLKPWDVAAGALLVREAGGEITATSAKPLQIDVPDMLASNGTILHNALSELLTQ